MPLGRAVNLEPGIEPDLSVRPFLSMNQLTLRPLS
jgi:hypothetical protein